MPAHLIVGRCRRIMIAITQEQQTLVCAEELLLGQYRRLGSQNMRRRKVRLVRIFPISVGDARCVVLSLLHRNILKFLWRVPSMTLWIGRWQSSRRRMGNHTCQRIIRQTRGRLQLRHLLWIKHNIFPPRTNIPAQCAIAEHDITGCFSHLSFSTRGIFIRFS